MSLWDPSSWKIVGDGKGRRESVVSSDGNTRYTCSETKRTKRPRKGKLDKVFQKSNRKQSGRFVEESHVTLHPDGKINKHK